MEVVLGSKGRESLPDRQLHSSTSASAAGRRRPRRNARAFIITKKTGTRIKTWMVDVIMPPTIGAAIGFITSEPTLDYHKMGMRLARTAATVISLVRHHRLLERFLHDVLKYSWDEVHEEAERLEHFISE
jgi:hypothetical protein